MADVPELVVGILAAPGAPLALAERLAGQLAAELAARNPQVAWSLPVVEDPLVEPPADDQELVAAARERLLAEDWDLVLVFTDLPLSLGRRPVIAHASALHGVAILSLPALGPVGMYRRALDTAVGLIRTLLADRAEDDPAPMGRRLRELARDLPGDGEGDGVRFTARVLSGHVRLLLGMVRANRPWRLAARLSWALTAAVAAGAFALVTSDIWRLADRLGWVRLAAIALGSVVAIAVTLIVGAGLWERAPHQRVRKQVALFNLATLATVVIGVLSFYAALFVVALAGALLLAVPSLFAQGLGHAVHPADYLALAWLTSSLATIGGALGAGLQSDESVRAAAYTYRPDRPLTGSPAAREPVEGGELPG